MKFLVKYILLGLIIFSIGCNSRDEELEKIKKENEKLKMEMLEKEKNQEDITKDVNKLKDKLAEIEKFETENERYKKVNIVIVVDPLKKDGRKWDLSGGPDIIGTITFSDTSISINSEENNFEVDETFPSLRIKVGDKIKVYLLDEDFSQHDLICNDEIIYKGEKVIKKKMGSAEVAIEIW